jgi:hypothetical protein
MSEPNLTSYREIAAGTTGAFMAPADVAVLLGEIDRLREENTRLRENTPEARARRALGDPRIGVSLNCCDAIG